MIHSHLSFILNGSARTESEYTKQLKESISNRLNSVYMRFHSSIVLHGIRNIYIEGASLLLPRGMKMKNQKVVDMKARDKEHTIIIMEGC